MRRKVRLEIPKSQKIKLNDINIQEEVESLAPSKEKIKLKKEYTSKDKARLLSSSGNLISVLIFLTITIVMIFNIIQKIDFTPKSSDKKVEVKLSTKLSGSWQSSYNGLFVFNEDNTFYWYNSFENLKDNYYRGEYKHRNGAEALADMGYTEEEFTKEFGSDIKLENVYSIDLKPNYAFMSGIDITTVELNENETWWYLLMIREDGTAFGYNKTLDIKYNLIKKVE